MPDAYQLIWALAIFGVGVFVLSVIASLDFQGTALVGAQLQNSSAAKEAPGIVFNFSKYSIQVDNSYVNTLPLAITASVIMIILSLLAGLFFRSQQPGGGGRVSQG